MNIWFSETGANVVLSAAFEKESQELTARRGDARALPRRTRAGEEKIEAQMGFFAVAGARMTSALGKPD